MLWLIGAMALAVVALLLVRAGGYSQLFSDAHFDEVARAAATLKAAAFARAQSTEPFRPGDPRAVLTSVGLAAVYTVRADGERFVHHVSVSIAGGHTAHAVGGRFVALLVNVLGWPRERTQWGLAPSTVHHAELVLTAEEHAQLAAAPVRVAPTAQLRRDADALANSVRWNRISAGAPST